MNAFAACLILSQMPSDQFLDLTPQGRTERFGQLLGAKRMVRVQSSLWQQFADDETDRAESRFGTIRRSNIFVITDFGPEGLLEHTTIKSCPVSYSLARYICDMLQQGVILFKARRKNYRDR